MKTGAMMIQSVWGVHTEYCKGEEGLDGVCVPGTKLKISWIFERSRFPSAGFTSQVAEG